MSSRTSVALDVRCLEQPFSSYARVIELIRTAAAAVDFELQEWRDGHCHADVLWTPGPALPQASNQPRLLITVQDLNPMLPDGRPAWARWRRARRYRKLIEEIDREAWRIVVPSQATADCLQQNFPHLQTPLVQIPWYPAAEFSITEAAPCQSDRALPEPGYLLYVGALRQHKNWPLVLQVYAALPDTLRQRHALVMVGSGHRAGKQARALAAQLGIADRIHWLEGLDNHQLATVYRNAAIFLFPSLLEGFGLPPLEAQACGTPVLAAATTSLPEILGDSAMLLEPHDLEAWRGAAIELLENKQAQQQARAQGLVNVKRYSPAVTAQSFLAVLALLDSLES